MRLIKSPVTSLSGSLISVETTIYIAAVVELVDTIGLSPIDQLIMQVQLLSAAPFYNERFRQQDQFDSGGSLGGGDILW